MYILTTYTFLDANAGAQVTRSVRILIASHGLGSGLAMRRAWHGIDDSRQNVIDEIILELAVRVEALPASRTGILFRRSELL